MPWKLWRNSKLRITLKCNNLQSEQSCLNLTFEIFCKKWYTVSTSGISSRSFWTLLTIQILSPCCDTELNVQNNFHELGGFAVSSLKSLLSFSWRNHTLVFKCVPKSFFTNFSVSSLSVKYWVLTLVHNNGFALSVKSISFHFYSLYYGLNYYSTSWPNFLVTFM